MTTAVPGWAQDPTPAPATPPAATPAAGANPTTSGNTNYDLRLRELGDRVDGLKQDVFRSKSRLLLLREQILRRSIGGARAVIEHHNDVSTIFELVGVSYLIDGTPVDISASLTDAVFNVYDSAVLPGPHTLTVSMRLKGNSQGGVFSYMEGYTLSVSRSLPFRVDEGRTFAVQVALVDTGIDGFVDGRFDIRFTTDEYETREAPAEQTPADNASAPAQGN